MKSLKTISYFKGKDSTMKNFFLLIAITLTNSVCADEGTTTYQTLPNSNIRDYRAPAFVTEGNTTYQTMPNSTVRDYRAPTYVTKGNTTYQTLPGSTVRDYSAPSYVTSKGKK